VEFNEVAKFGNLPPTPESILKYGMEIQGVNIAEAADSPKI
jgi:hypothetical protein